MKLDDAGAYARCCLAWPTCFVAARSAFSPDSVIGELLKLSGIAGHIAQVLLLAACVLLVLDVLINDVMPARFTFARARRWRPGIFMLLAWVFGWLTVAGWYIWGLDQFSTTVGYLGISILAGWGSLAIAVHRHRRVPP
jgi:hypothetical protein